MAHPQQLQFVKSVTSIISENHNFKSKKVLEIGSYDVNGSVRQFFPYSDYIGVDLIKGPGVDLICEGDKISHDDNIYDIAISCECFEHNPAWAETFKNMYRMTKDGGLVIFTCATAGRSEHGTTRTSPNNSPGTQAINWDYYNNLTENDFNEKFSLHELFNEHFFLVNQSSCDLYFFGIKGRGNSVFEANTTDIKKYCQADQEELQNQMSSRKSREKYIPKPLRKVVKKLFLEKFDKKSNIRLIDNF
jgi:SAM-dependent methyltransferase